MIEILREAHGSVLLKPIAEGREWDVILIETGLSKNETFYSADVLKAAMETAAAEPDSSRVDAPHVLIAPSWGHDNLLDRCGVGLAEALSESGYRITIRPHPLFFLQSEPVMADLQALALRCASVDIESSLQEGHAMLTADVMVGDYSGASFESSF